MSIEETRQLGIEFERRVQAIDPTAEIVGKLDTDDIYSYLNQYQLQYVKGLYTAEDQMQSQSRTAYKVSDILKPLITHDRLEKYDKPTGVDTFDKHTTLFYLPENYFSYIRSVSKTFGNYKEKSTEAKIHYTPNLMLKQSDANKVIDAFFDEHKILRNPICTFAGQEDDMHRVLEVIHDQYTSIMDVDLTYIRQPNKFGIHGTAKDSVACELPKDCFEDLVSGAVDLFFNYKYKISLASQAARRNATRAELGTDKQPTQQQTLEAEQ